MAINHPVPQTPILQQVTAQTPNPLMIRPKVREFDGSDPITAQLWFNSFVSAVTMIGISDIQKAQSFQSHLTGAA